MTTTSFHELTVSAPDGTGRTEVVRLDGQRVYPTSLYLRCSGHGVFQAQLTYDVVFEFTGLADVTAENTREGRDDGE